VWEQGLGDVLDLDVGGLLACSSASSLTGAAAATAVVVGRRRRWRTLLGALALLASALSPVLLRGGTMVMVLFIYGTPT